MSTCHPPALQSARRLLTLPMDRNPNSKHCKSKWKMPGQKFPDWQALWISSRCVEKWLDSFSWAHPKFLCSSSSTSWQPDPLLFPSSFHPTSAVLQTHMYRHPSIHIQSPSPPPPCKQLPLGHHDFSSSSVFQSPLRASPWQN